MEEMTNGVATKTEPAPPMPKVTKKTEKKAAKKARVKAHRTSAKRSAKRSTPKPLSKTGARRNPKEHIMSVHIPVGLLAKLDRKVVALRKSGKRSSRSMFAVQAIESKL